MNKKFYGSIDELLEKLSNLNIDYKIDNDKIIIGNGYIKYKEEYLPIRSFSVTRFPKKGLDLFYKVYYCLINTDNLLAGTMLSRYLLQSLKNKSSCVKRVIIIHY